jgi:hypothetical protein
METATYDIQQTSSQLTLANRWDHILARWAFSREGHLVNPGLYAIGKPNSNSPVFVTANYTLSFDALRSALDGVDAYILVLDTKGVNVWCAAGKGTFGTDELVHRIEGAQLKNVVQHRDLILPQLGAPGIAAHEVRKRSGFKVTYGPVRAEDLPAYLKTREATAEMRRVHFTLWDRIVLVPVELVAVLIPLLIVGLLLRSAGLIASILAGVVLFPILLPWLPTPNFSTKGYILGGVVAIPFVFSALFANPEASFWLRAAWALAFALTLPPITAFLALNFTGSTTQTSRTGVRREIYRYAPSMAWMFIPGGVLYLSLFFLRFFGG